MKTCCRVTLWLACHGWFRYSGAVCSVFFFFIEGKPKLKLNPSFGAKQGHPEVNTTQFAFGSRDRPRRSTQRSAIKSRDRGNAFSFECFWTRMSLIRAVPEQRDGSVRPSKQQSRFTDCFWMHRGVNVMKRRFIIWAVWRVYDFSHSCCGPNCHKMKKNNVFILKVFKCDF